MTSSITHLTCSWSNTKWTTSLNHTQGSPFALICSVCGLDVSPVVYVWAAWTVKPLYIHVIYNHRFISLQWSHNGRDSVSNYQPHHCLLNRLFRRWSKKTSKLRVTGLCAGNSPETGEFPVQMASNAENVSIWWRHHVATHFNISKRKRIHRMQCVLLTCVLYLGVLTTFPDIHVISK